MAFWPASAAALVALQEALGVATEPPWQGHGDTAVAGCFVCFPRGIAGRGAAGDPAWAAAACGEEVVVHAGRAAAPYEPGMLALREGALLEAAVRALVASPDVLLVNATGRDHPRRAGLALHLGAVLGLPSIGVTHRPLYAAGERPTDRRGATAPLLLAGEEVGRWVVTRRGRRPLAVTPGWRTGIETAVEVVLACAGAARTPEPLRAARRAARLARAAG